MRGTLIGVHETYGSSCSFRLSRSCLAHGSSGSSPGFSPPSRSMSALEPAPSHGPERSGWPSGMRGTGPLTSLSATSGVPPEGMLETRCCAFVCASSASAKPRTIAEPRTVLFTIASLRGGPEGPPLRQKSSCASYASRSDLRGSEIDLRAELEHPAAEDLQRPQPLAAVGPRVARGHAQHVARVEQV